MGKVLELLQERIAPHILETHQYRGDETVVVDRSRLLEVASVLRDDPALACEVLMDLTAVDYPEEALRFEVVYHFLSMTHNHRLRLKVRVAEDDAVVPSLCALWPGANWLEREAYDMFGVRFEGHPDLKRILMYEEFEGHPLRKDYPYQKRQPLLGPHN